MSALPIVMMLIFGAPSFAAMTPALWAIFALNTASSLPKAIKTERKLIAFINSPAFRAWAAANGEAAIRLRPGEITER